MKAFKPLKTKVAESGRPTFCKGETEMLQQTGVGFYDGDVRSTQYEDGTLYLTTHRLVWVEKNSRKGIYLPLGELSRDLGRWQGFFYMSHPKIILKIVGGGQFKISFRDYGMEAFRGKLAGVLGKRSWEGLVVGNYDVSEEKNEILGRNKTEDLVLIGQQAKVTGGVLVENGVITGLGYNATAVFDFESCSSGPHDGVIEHTHLTSDTTFCVVVNESRTYHPKCLSTTSRTTLSLHLNPGQNTITLTQLPSTPTPPPQISKLILKPLSRKSPATHSDPAASIGIARIVDKIETQDKVAAEKLEDAFSDVDTLMDAAREVTQLIRNFQEKVASGKGKGGSQEEQSEIDQQQAMLDNWVAELGMSSVVTKDTVGMGNYHFELAKQLSEFLEEPLKRSKAVLTTVDAYCLYNKARGSELVSPDDFMRACEKLRKVKGSNITLAKFGTGKKLSSVLRLTSSPHDAAVMEAVESGKHITPFALATKLKISVPVATDILQGIEVRGLLCRDDQAAEGVAFYKNMFMQVV